MSNGEDMMTYLLVGLIKKTLNKISLYKNESIFPKPCRSLEEILMLTLIFQIMQQKLILKL